MKDYYKVLGLEKNATEKEINMAYCSFVAEGQISHVINEAYETLIDDEKRKAHDNALTVCELKDILSDGIFLAFASNIFEKDENVPWDLLMEDDQNRYIPMNLRKRVDQLSRTDRAYRGVRIIWKAKMQNVINYCQNNHVIIDFPKIESAIESSVNKGVVYWMGENEPPELYFKSTAYKNKETLYVYKEKARRRFFNKVKMQADGQTVYCDVKSEEAKIVLSDFLEER